MQTSDEFSATACLEDYIRNFEIRSNRKGTNSRNKKTNTNCKKPKTLTKTKLDFDYKAMACDNLTSLNLNNDPINQVESLIKNLSFQITQYKSEMSILNPTKERKNPPETTYSTCKPKIECKISPDESEAIAEKKNESSTKTTIDLFNTVRTEEKFDPVLESLNKFKQLNEFLAKIGEQKESEIELITN